MSNVNFMCLYLLLPTNGDCSLCKDLLVIPEEVLKWEKFDPNKMDFIYDLQNCSYMDEQHWKAVKSVYDKHNTIGVDVTNSCFLVVGNENVNFNQLKQSLYDLIDDEIVNKLEMFIDTLKCFNETDLSVINTGNLITTLINNKPIPFKHIVICDKWADVDSDDELDSVVDTDKRILIDAGFVDVSCISDCVLLESDGYRGTQYYFGAVKIGNAWFWLDLCNGDLTFINNWTSDEVQNVLKS